MRAIGKVVFKSPLGTVLSAIYALIVVAVTFKSFGCEPGMLDLCGLPFLLVNFPALYVIDSFHPVVIDFHRNIPTFSDAIVIVLGIGANTFLVYILGLVLEKIFDGVFHWRAKPDNAPKPLSGKATTATAIAVEETDGTRLEETARLVVEIGVVVFIIAMIPAIYVFGNQIRDQMAVSKFERALNVELPENVEFLVERVSDRVVNTVQNPSGRYMLTPEGVYDFKNNQQIPFTCGIATLVPNFRRPLLWINDGLFLAQGCAFIVTPSNLLESGEFTYLEYHEVDSTQDFLQANEVYNRGETFYFVRYHPLHIWATKARDIDNQALLVKLEDSIEIPPQTDEAGRRVRAGTRQRSPDGKFEVALDKKPGLRGGNTLTVRRVSNNATIAKISVWDIHGIKEDMQMMAVEGWTDDSKHIVFSVSTLFPYPYEKSLNGKKWLGDLLVLNIEDE